MAARYSPLRTSILAGTALAIAASGAPDARAQQTGVGIEEITVTARKREESIQDIPIAVTAFSPENLQALQAENLEGLQGAIPNVNIAQGRGTQSNANVFIRGIGQQDPLTTFDPGVGIFIDGVFYSRVQGALADFFAVDRIEVLRGPQGTLFGKNTIGGAIKIETKGPSDEYEAQFRVSGGNFDLLEGNLFVAGPIIDGVLTGSLSLGYFSREGFVEDRSSDRTYNNRDTQAARAKLRYTPTDSLAFTLAADWTRERPSITLGRQQDTLITAPIPIPGLPFGGVDVLAPAPEGQFDFTAETPIPDQNDLDHRGITLTTDWDINDSLALKSITAIRDLETDQFQDIDTTPAYVGDIFVAITQDQISQEFQLNYTDDKLDAVGGLYFLRENIKTDQGAFFYDLLDFLGDGSDNSIPGLNENFGRVVADDQITMSYAAFGEATYDVTDRWSLTGGVRITYEEKDYKYTNTSIRAAVPPGQPGFDILNFFEVPTDPSSFTVTENEQFFNVSPRATIQFRPTATTLTYFTIARGFKSGGFNGRATSPQQFGIFEEETVLTYEVGGKADLFDNRLRLNLAAFLSNYNDFQASVPIGTGADTFSAVINADGLDQHGVELEFTALPIDGLTITGNFAWLDSEYDGFDFDSDGDGVNEDNSGLEPIFSPEITTRLAAEYRYSVADTYEVFFGADWQYRDDTFLNIFNDEQIKQDDYTLWNGRVGVSSIDGTWTLSGGVENAGDTVYAVDAQDFSGLGNLLVNYFGAPRTWNVTFTYRY